MRNYSIWDVNRTVWAVGRYRGNLYGCCWFFDWLDALPLRTLIAAKVWSVAACLTSLCMKWSPNSNSLFWKFSVSCNKLSYFGYVWCIIFWRRILLDSATRTDQRMIAFFLAFPSCLRMDFERFFSLIGPSRKRRDFPKSKIWNWNCLHDFSNGSIFDFEAVHLFSALRRRYVHRFV